MAYTAILSFALEIERFLKKMVHVLKAELVDEQCDTSWNEMWRKYGKYDWILCLLMGVFPLDKQEIQSIY